MTSHIELVDGATSPDGAEDADRFRRDPSAGLSRGKRALLIAGAGVCLLAIWQVGLMLWGKRVPGQSATYMATPIGVLKAAGPILSDVTFSTDTYETHFWQSVTGTLAAVGEGLVLAIVLGTLLGLVMGRLPDLNRILGTYVNLFFAIPLVALLPLFTLWFHDDMARFAIVLFEAALPVIYNVGEGCRVVSRTYLDVTAIHRVPWYRVWFGVVLPNAVAYILAGLDLAIGRALIGAVVSEFFLPINGLGRFIRKNVESFHQNQGVWGLVALVAFALIVRALINLAVRRSLPWYRTTEDAS
jgi:ABC-type nitrate/sulfonate/bicarbonate transport system permease component